jgi:glucose-1-phosphate cytidylyltransferase
MTEPRIKKVVIFAGGEGTRLSEKTGNTPKPLVPIGDDPVVVHIMRHFYSQGYREFILLVGYKSEQFKQYFRDYDFRGRSVTFCSNDGMTIHGKPREDWTVHVVETGESSETGRRLALARDFIGDDDFFLTYGDSVSDVDLSAVEAAHFSSRNIVTMTAVGREERFGIIKTDGVAQIESFSEKANSTENLINGGFMICDNKLLNRVTPESGDYAYETLTKLATDGELGFYRHDGFWHAMDTKRDLDKLTKMYADNPKLFG